MLFRSLADKLIVMASLVWMVPMGRIAPWVVVLLLARDISINCYLDVEIGDCALIADSVYISDFDHRFADLTTPIKDQGIAKSRVRIGRDVWLGTKVTVARGVEIGAGAVVGANSVVTKDLPAYSVSVGAPARVIKDRRAKP